MHFSRCPVRPIYFSKSPTLGKCSPKQPRDIKHLKRILNYFIKDYNTVKPHGNLKRLTPDEAWKGAQINDTHRTTVLKEARINRLEYG